MTSRSAPLLLSADAIDALALGVMALNDREEVVLWNRWLVETSGRRREEVLGRPFLQVFPELTDQRIAQAVGDALRYGHPALLSQSLHRSPFPLVRGPHRQPIQQSVQVTPFFSEGVRYCLIQINDVTFVLERERVLRRQAMELREAQQRQLALLNGIAEMAWLKDDGGRYLAVNQAYAEILGTTADQLAGRTDFDFYPEGDALRYQDEDREVMESATPRRTEEIQYGSDGQARWVEKIKVPVIGPTGKVIGTAGTARDVTERKEAEGQIQRLNEELEHRVQRRTAELEHANEALLASNMELERFAYAAAHDLQTPLRSIAGFAQLLQKEVQGQGDGQLNEWAALVVENTRRLQMLILELLAYSRLGAQARAFEPVDLQNLLEKVVVSLNGLVKDSGTQVRGENLPTLSVDRSQMAQLFQNLIENGIKYNKSRPPIITVSCERRGDEWLFAVTDNGIGIDPRHHGRIFEIFRRLHSYSQVPGTGIGLAICARIVEHHGGRIWVESRPGEGSTFRFTLPVERTAA